MKLVRLSSWGMCAVVLAFFLTASTPSKPSASLAKPLFEGHAVASTQPVNSEEWTKIGEWMRANNCAHRYDFVDRVLPDGPLRAHAKQLIAERYRAIQRVRDTDLRNALVSEVQAQDQIFALQIEYRRSHRRERPMAEMKLAVEKLIDSRIAHLRAEEKLLLQRKSEPQFVSKQARGYFENAEKPRQLRSTGELGTDRGDETSDAGVAQ